MGKTNKERDKNFGQEQIQHTGRVLTVACRFRKRFLLGSVWSRQKELGLASRMRIEILKSFHGSLLNQSSNYHVQISPSNQRPRPRLCYASKLIWAFIDKPKTRWSRETSKTWN
ncbi:hypothetical protein WN944_008047 [Citrus x changshan-huyou]|uniref:Uncharacterized protein n=1 Tax=Citrus x changshan-huyou TaxID=2935761 RepID=A0AAP0MTK3_9ROSI